ncbi:hypothetical protein [Streptomyces sp. A1547]|uniref:hypothetical protein n=1 Tax=Streptomyces sp. A1547 TaxID=2563105 RepID=UPI00109EC260|nr:hypothetical protein [Streptomyces sp. A1547]THA38105.1 hypothetical protein E6W17_16595 [Streptomyces sp. A1547]
MTQNTGESYQLPDDSHLAQVLDRAEAPNAKADDVARIMCLLLAAEVRDILTGHEYPAPFDATGLELLCTAEGAVRTSGAYWTGDGTRREFEEAGAEYHLDAWACELDDTNRDTWSLLCELLSDDGATVRYRLDLTRAATL